MSCQFPVSDYIHKVKVDPCPSDYTSYLQLRYRCQAGAFEATQKHDMFTSDHQKQFPLISLLLSSSTKRRYALQPATDTVDVTTTRLPFLHVTTSCHVTVAILSMDAVRDTNTNLAVPPAQFERYAAKPPMSPQDGFHSTAPKKSTDGLMSFGNLTPERTPATQLLIERCDVSFRTIIICCW